MLVGSSVGIIILNTYACIDGWMDVLMFACMNDVYVYAHTHEHVCMHEYVSVHSSYELSHAESLQVRFLFRLFEVVGCALAVGSDLGLFFCCSKVLLVTLTLSFRSSDLSYVSENVSKSVKSPVDKNLHLRRVKLGLSSLWSQTRLCARHWPKSTEQPISSEERREGKTWQLENNRTRQLTD